MIIKIFFNFIVFLLLLNNNVFSQTVAEDFSKLMYVTSKEGLRERSEPSTNSNIIETHRYGAMIKVFSRQNNPVTINGITDYWYSTRSYSGRWIFGGYLSEKLPNDLPVIIGYWDVVDVVYTNQYYRFDSNNNYASGAKDIGGGGQGKWKFRGYNYNYFLEYE
jgi:hypothetical protein